MGKLKCYNTEILKGCEHGSEIRSRRSTVRDQKAEIGKAKIEKLTS